MEDQTFASTEMATELIITHMWPLCDDDVNGHDYNYEDYGRDDDPV